MRLCILNDISIGSAVFTQLTAERPILYNRPLLSPQNCPFVCGISAPSNTWFLGPTRVHIPNGISIGSTVFAGLTIVTARLTDRQTTLLRL